MNQLISPRALRWLRDGRSARVLNHFKQVCNLVDDEHNVISLVTADVGPGPFSLLVGDSLIARIDPDSPVKVDSESLSISIGAVTIRAAETAVWNAKPAWETLQLDALPAYPFFLPINPALSGPVDRLLRGLYHHDPAAIQSAAFDLAGLGSGLTPSGDDILMGILFGLWVCSPDKRWIDLIVDTAVPRTTTLSAAFLRAAQTGEATIHWHKVVNGIPGAAGNILSIGATSGCDAWYGFTRLCSSFASRVV